MSNKAEQIINVMEVNVYETVCRSNIIMASRIKGRLTKAGEVQGKLKASEIMQKSPKN